MKNMKNTRKNKMNTRKNNGRKTQEEHLDGGSVEAWKWLGVEMALIPI